MTFRPTAIVSISGGKDSLATACVALDQLGPDRVRLVWADTGHEHPETVAYVREYLPFALGVSVKEVRAEFSEEIARKREYVAIHWEAKGVPATRVARALELLHPTGNPYLDLCLWKGRFPSRTRQFCTDYLKARPLEAWTIAFARAHGGPRGLESWQGVRRDESASRADALLWERHDAGWLVHRPIAAWTVAQVINYVRAHGLRLNPLYAQGMRRVGCMPCINVGKDELLEISKRWPGEVDRVAEWEALVSAASRRGASSFLHVDSAHGDEGDAEIFARACIGARVEWSRTSRGGTQYDLERAIPPAACSSYYGMCE